MSLLTLPAKSPPPAWRLDLFPFDSIDRDEGSSDFSTISTEKRRGGVTEVGVLGFLVRESSSGMVQSADSSKRRAGSTPHPAPSPPKVKLELKESLDDERGPLHKRSRDASTSNQQVDESLLFQIKIVGI